jgi:hypothetical protein
MNGDDCTRRSLKAAAALQAPTPFGECGAMRLTPTLGFEVHLVILPQIKPVGSLRADPDIRSPRVSLAAIWRDLRGFDQRRRHVRANCRPTQAREEGNFTTTLKRKRIPTQAS